MKYKLLLVSLIPLVMMGIQPASLLAQEENDGEEDGPIQTRPRPDTSPDPLSNKGLTTKQLQQQQLQQTQQQKLKQQQLQQQQQNQQQLQQQKIPQH